MAKLITKPSEFKHPVVSSLELYNSCLHSLAVKCRIMLSRIISIRVDRMVCFGKTINKQ